MKLLKTGFLQDFGVSWQDTMDRGGIVVGNEIDITIDVEAVLEDG